MVSWLVEGIYWEPRYPRVLSKDGLKAAVENGTNKLMGVTDISADECGSIEFTSRFTSIEEPFLLYDPVMDEFQEKIGDMSKAHNHEILFHSVDHLPAEMPKEASNHFGSKLIEFVEAVVKSDFSKPFDQQDDIPPEIKGAIICCHGKLAPDYEYIQSMRETNALLQKREDDRSETSSTGIQGFTICLIGHLFDTKGLSEVLDACEEYDVHFRVVDWDVGLNVSS